MKAGKSYSYYTENDSTTAEGLLNLIYCIMVLHVRGLNWYAIVCSTWVWMSQSSTGRTHKGPSGNNTDVVRLTNSMLTSACLTDPFGCIEVLPLGSGATRYIVPSSLPQGARPQQ